MKWELNIVKRGRKCNLCKQQIDKEKKCFVSIEWIEGQKYPNKQNVCMPCAFKVSDQGFIDFLERTIERCENLQDSIRKHNIENTEKLTLF